ncbi:MAG: hypothetical protein HQL30_11745, partial [Candidatus Omnitrophica bacterium]|nr:hypothetical protein [Candidatus Omnitrophota bacterium]
QSEPIYGENGNYEGETPAVNDSDSFAIYGTESYQDNNWHLLTITYEGEGTSAGVIVYVDGQKKGERSIRINGAMEWDDQQVTQQIGAHQNSSSFRGNLDEVGVYGNALTPVEIQELMHNAPYRQSEIAQGGTYDDLMAYYGFENGAAIDTSGNGNNGTVQGTILVSGNHAPAVADEIIREDYEYYPPSSQFSGEVKRVTVTNPDGGMTYTDYLYSQETGRVIRTVASDGTVKDYEYVRRTEGEIADKTIDMMGTMVFVDLDMSGTDPIYTFRTSDSVMGSGRIGDDFKFGGNDYVISGTGINDVVISSKATRFDGQTDYIRFNAVPYAPDLVDMTLSTWALVDEDEDSAAIIGWNEGDGQGNNDQGGGFGLIVDGDFICAKAVTQDVDNSSRRDDFFRKNVRFDISALKGEWAHYAVTYKRLGQQRYNSRYSYDEMVEVSLYANGVMVSSASTWVCQGRIADYTNFQIGSDSPYMSDPDNVSYPFKGEVGESAIWSGALTGFAIKDIYEGAVMSGMPDYPAKCVGWWSLDGYYDNVIDKTGRGRNGAPHGVKKGLSSSPVTAPVVKAGGEILKLGAADDDKLLRAVDTDKAINVIGAVSSYNQNGYNISKAFDGVKNEAANGWSIGGMTDQSAMFAFDGQQLVDGITLTQGVGLTNDNLRDFDIYYTVDPTPSLDTTFWTPVNNLSLANIPDLYFISNGERVIIDKANSDTYDIVFDTVKASAFKLVARSGSSVDKKFVLNEIEFHGKERAYSPASEPLVDTGADIVSPRDFAITAADDYFASRSGMNVIAINAHTSKTVMPSFTFPVSFGAVKSDVTISDGLMTSSTPLPSGYSVSYDSSSRIVKLSYLQTVLYSRQLDEFSSLEGSGIGSPVINGVDFTVTMGDAAGTVNSIHNVFVAGELSTTTGPADLTGDGKLDPQDVDYIKLMNYVSTRKRADLDNSGIVDGQDAAIFAAQPKDVDGNGSINPVDLVELNRISALDAETFKKADINGDNQIDQSDMTDYLSYISDATGYSTVVNGDMYKYLNATGGFRAFLSPEILIPDVPEGWTIVDGVLKLDKTAPANTVLQSFTIQLEADQAGVYDLGIQARNPYLFDTPGKRLEINTYVNGNFSETCELDVDTFSRDFQKLLGKVSLRSGVNEVKFVIWDLNGDGSRTERGTIPSNIPAGYGVGLEIGAFYFAKNYSLALDLDLDNVISSEELEEFSSFARPGAPAVSSPDNSVKPVLVGDDIYAVTMDASNIHFTLGSEVYSCGKTNPVVKLANAKDYAVTFEGSEVMLVETQVEVDVLKNVRFVEAAGKVYRVTETGTQGIFSFENDGVVIAGLEPYLINIGDMRYSIAYTGEYSTIVLRPATRKVADSVMYLGNETYGYRYDNGRHVILSNGEEYYGVPVAGKTDTYSVNIGGLRLVELFFDNGEPFLKELGSAVSESIPMGEVLEIYRVDNMTGEKIPGSSNYVRAIANTFTESRPKQIITIVTGAYTAVVTLKYDGILAVQGIDGSYTARVNKETGTVEILDADGNVSASKAIPDMTFDVHNPAGQKVGSVTVGFTGIISASLSAGYTVIAGESGAVVTSSAVKPHVLRYWDSIAQKNVVAESYYENGKEIVYVNDIRYILKTDVLGHVYIARDRERSTAVADQLISLNGDEYFVKRNSNGTFTFTDVDGVWPSETSTFEAQGTILTPVVWILGVKYAVMVSYLTASVTLDEITTKVYSDKEHLVQLLGDEYSIKAATSVAGIYGFTNGEGVTIWSDLSNDEVKTLELGDVTYKLEVEIGRMLQQPRVIKAVELYGDLGGPNGDPDGKVNAWDIAAFNHFAQFYKDVNGDGVINALDVTSLERLIYIENTKGITPENISYYRELADVNKDYVVSAKDATDLYNSILNRHDIDGVSYVTLENNRYAFYEENGGYKLQIITTDSKGKQTRGDAVYQAVYDSLNKKYTVSIPVGNTSQQYVFRESDLFYTMDDMDLDIAGDILADMDLGLLLQPYRLWRADVNKSGSVNKTDYTDLQESFMWLNLWADHFNMPLPKTALVMERAETGLANKIRKRMSEVRQSETLRELYEITPSKIARADIDGDKKVELDDIDWFNYAKDRYPWLRYYSDYNNNGVFDYGDVATVDEVISGMAQVSAPQPSFMRRVDVNGDGVFNLLDMETISRAIMYYQSLDQDNDVDDQDMTKLARIQEFMRMGIAEERDLILERVKGLRSEHFADQKLSFNGKEYFVQLMDGGQFNFYDASGDRYLSYAGLDFVQIHGIIADVSLDQDGRVQLRERHESGSPFRTSTFLADEVVNVGTRKFDVIRDLGADVIRIRENGRELTSFTRPLSGEKAEIDIDGTTYLAYMGAGETKDRLFLICTDDASANVYDERISLDGTEYTVKRNNDGTYDFASSLETKKSTSDGKKVMLGGTVYDIKKNMVNSRITLIESHRESEEVCTQVIELNNKTYEVVMNLNGTYDLKTLNGVVLTGDKITTAITKKTLKSGTYDYARYQFVESATQQGTVVREHTVTIDNRLYDILPDYDTGKMQLVQRYQTLETRYDPILDREVFVVWAWVPPSQTTPGKWVESKIPVTVNGQGNLVGSPAGYYTRQDFTAQIGAGQLSFDVVSGRAKFMSEHKVSQTLMGQLIEVNDTPYEVVRNSDGTITFRDIVYASKRYTSNATLNKVNIEGHVYDVVLSPFTQKISLVEEFSSVSEHLSDAGIMVNGELFYSEANDDGSFTLSDRPDLNDPAGKRFNISADSQGSITAGGDIYEPTILVKSDGENADINGDGFVTSADATLLNQKISEMASVDITGDNYVDRSDLEKMDTIISGIEKGELINPFEYHRVDMNGNGLLDKGDWEMIEDSFAKLYLDQDLNSDGHRDHLDWELHVKTHPVTNTYTGVYGDIDVPARSLTGGALFTRDDMQRVYDVKNFMRISAAYDIPEGLGVYGNDFVIYNAESPELMSRYDLNGDNRVDDKDVAEMKNVVWNIYQYDINNDSILNDEDMAAWDSMKAYWDLARGIGEEDISTANITGDYDFRTGDPTVNGADIQRFKAISGYNEITKTFRNFDVNNDGEVTMLDVTYIQRVKYLDNIVENTILPFLKAKYDVEWAKAQKGTNVDLWITNNIDEMEGLLLNNGWIDLNKDGKVDNVDLDTYNALYLDYQKNNGVPSSLDIVNTAPLGINVQDKLAIVDVESYLKALNLYGDGVTYDMTNILAMKYALETLNVEVGAQGIYTQVTDQYQKGGLYLQDILGILASTDFDRDGSLTVQDLARFYDVYEADALREKLEIQTKSDLFKDSDDDGFDDYDVNKDGYINDTDLELLKEAYKNFPDYDMASYAGTDVNGDGKIDGNDLSTVSDGKVDGADLAFLDVSQYYQMLEHTITDSQILAANIVVDFDSAGNVIIDDKDYEAMANYISYMKDVNMDMGTKAIMTLSSDEYRLLQTLVGRGGLTPDSVKTQGLGDLDLNGDGAISVADLMVEEGGVNTQDIYAVTGAYQLLVVKGYTLKDIYSLDTDFDGVLTDRDRSSLEKVFKAQDLTAPGVMDKIRMLNTIQYRGARIPLNWLVGADINGDTVIDQRDETALKNAVKYHLDVNLDGNVSEGDKYAIKQIISMRTNGFTPEEIIAADLNKDSRIDGQDVATMKRALSMLSKYDLNADDNVDSLDLMTIYDVLGTDPVSVMKQETDEAETLLEKATIAAYKAEAVSYEDVVASMVDTMAILRDHSLDMAHLMGDDPRKETIEEGVELEWSRLNDILRAIRDIAGKKPDKQRTAVDNAEEIASTVAEMRVNAGKAGSAMELAHLVDLSGEMIGKLTALYQEVERTAARADMEHVAGLMTAAALDRDAIKALYDEFELSEREAGVEMNKISSAVTKLKSYVNIVTAMNDPQTSLQMLETAMDLFSDTRSALGEINRMFSEYSSNTVIAGDRKKAAETYEAVTAGLEELQKTVAAVAVKNTRPVFDQTSQKFVLGDLYPVTGMEKTLLSLKLIAAELISLEAIEKEEEFIKDLYSRALNILPDGETIKSGLNRLFGAGGATKVYREDIIRELMISEVADLPGIEDYTFLEKAYRAFVGKNGSYDDIAPFVHAISAKTIDRAGAISIFVKAAKTRRIESEFNDRLTNKQYVEHVLSQIIPGEYSSDTVDAYVNDLSNNTKTRTETLYEIAGIEYPVTAASLSSAIFEESSLALFDTGNAMLDSESDLIKSTGLSVLDYAGVMINIDSTHAEGEIPIDKAKLIAALKELSDGLKASALKLEGSALDVIDTAPEKTMLLDKIALVMGDIHGAVSIIDSISAANAQATTGMADKFENYYEIEKINGKMAALSGSNMSVYDKREYLDIINAYKDLQGISREKATEAIAALSGPESGMSQAGLMSYMSMYSSIMDDGGFIAGALDEAVLGYDQGRAWSLKADKLADTVKYIAANITYSQSAQEAQALSGIAGYIMSELDTYSSGILDHVPGGIDPSELSDAKTHIDSVIAGLSADIENISTEMYGISKDESDVNRLKELTSAKREVLKDLAAKLKTSVSLSETKAILAAIKKGYRELVSFTESVNYILVKYPNNETVRAEVKDMNSASSELSAMIYGADRDVMVADAKATSGRTVLTMAREKTAVLNAISSLIGTMSAENAISMEQLTRQAIDIKNSVKGYLDVMRIVALSMPGDAEAAQTLSDIDQLYSQVVVPGCLAVKTSAYSALAISSDGKFLEQKAGELNKAAENAKLMAQESEDAGLALLMLDAIDGIHGELVELNAMAGAIVAAGNNSQVFLDARAVVTAASDISVYRDSVLERSSLLKVRQIKNSAQSYNAMFTDILNEIEISGKNEAWGLYGVADNIASRVLELTDQAVEYSRNYPTDEAISAELVQVQKGLADALKSRAEVERAAYIREGSIDNLGSMKTRVSLIQTAIDELNRRANLVNTLTENGLRDLIALRAMAEKAYSDYVKVMDAALAVKQANPENTTIPLNYAVLATYDATLRQKLYHYTGSLATIEDKISEAVINVGSGVALDMYAIVTDYSSISSRVAAVSGSVAQALSDTAIGDLSLSEYITGIGLKSVKDLYATIASRPSGKFFDGFENGDVRSYWDTVQIWNGYGGLTSDPEQAGVFDGNYVLELKGWGNYVEKELGDLTGAGWVNIEFEGAVSSLDYNWYQRETMDMDFFDGTAWHEGVVRFTSDDNDEGYIHKAFTVPPAWLSSNNRVRFTSRANSTGDYFYVDNVLVTTSKDLARRPTVDSVKGYVEEVEALAQGEKYKRVTAELSTNSASISDLAASEAKTLSSSRILSGKTNDIETAVYLAGAAEKALSVIAAAKNIAAAKTLAADKVLLIESLFSAGKSAVADMSLGLKDPKRTVMNGDSAISIPAVTKKALLAIELQSGLPWNMTDLQGFSDLIGYVLQASSENEYEARLEAAEYSTSIVKAGIREAVYAFNKANSSDGDAIGRSIGIKIDVMDANDALVARTNALSSVAAAALAAMSNAAGTEAAGAYLNIAVNAAAISRDNAALAAETFKVLEKSEKVRSSVFSTRALASLTSNTAILAVESFEAGWVKTFEISPSGDFSVNVSGDTITITMSDPSNGHDIEFVLRNRELVKITDKVSGLRTDVDGYNSVFTLSSDGASVWRVTMSDGSVVAFKDAYTVSITDLSLATREWIGKIQNYAEGVDLTAVENEASPALKDYMFVVKVAEAVSDFFGKVAKAYQYGFKTVLLPEERSELEFYRPFINMLKAANPIALATGGLTAITSWLISQGSKITNCAVKALAGYYEATGKTAVSKERMAIMSVISDVLTGLITPLSTGELETTLFTLKSEAAANGVRLKGLATDVPLLSVHDMPVIAVIEEAFMRHIVMLTAVTTTSVTYVSNGASITATKEDFTKLFKGYILSAGSPVAGEKEIDDSGLMAISGSLANVLESKTDNLVQYLASTLADMSNIFSAMGHAVSAFQAGESMAMARADLSEISKDADYAEAEWLRFPDNQALKLNKDRARKIENEAIKQFTAIEALYSKIASAETLSERAINS